MSLRKAINQKSRECIHDEKAAGTWLKQVEDCTSYQCPLYLVRPLTGQTKRQNAVKNEQPEGLKKYREAAA
ncbi:MAG: hypothetical protein V3U75_01820 [Methylococcaceae bacterium]